MTWLMSPWWSAPHTSSLPSSIPVLFGIFFPAAENNIQPVSVYLVHHPHFLMWRTLGGSVHVPSTGSFSCSLSASGPPLGFHSSVWSPQPQHLPPGMVIAWLFCLPSWAKKQPPASLNPLFSLPLGLAQFWHNQQLHKGSAVEKGPTLRWRSRKVIDASLHFSRSTVEFWDSQVLWSRLILLLVADFFPPPILSFLFYKELTDGLCTLFWRELLACLSGFMPSVPDQSMIFRREKENVG